MRKVTWVTNTERREEELTCCANLLSLQNRNFGNICWEDKEWVLSSKNYFQLLGKLGLCKQTDPQIRSLHWEIPKLENASSTAVIKGIRVAMCSERHLLHGNKSSSVSALRVQFWTCRMGREATLGVMFQSSPEICRRIILSLDRKVMFSNMISAFVRNVYSLTKFKSVKIWGG